MNQMNSCVIKLIVLLLLLNCFPGRVIGQENEAISDGDQGWVDMFPNSTLDGDEPTRHLIPGPLTTEC